MRKALLLTAVVMLIILPCNKNLAKERVAAQLPQETQKIKVDVNLLQLEVTVVDKNGRLVTNLEKGNFRLVGCPSGPEIDVGKKKKIMRTSGKPCDVLDPSGLEKQNVPPMRIAVVDDTSGSTEGYLKEVSSPSIVRLLRTLIPALNEEKSKIMGARTDDKFALLEFTERPKELIDWTQDIASAENALHLLYSDGSSAVYDALWTTVNKKMRPLQGPEKFTKFIVLVTDGADQVRFPIIAADGSLCTENRRLSGSSSACREVTNSDIVKSLYETGTILFVVDSSARFSKNDLQSSFRPPLNPPEELGEIARLSGGEQFLVSNAKEAERAFEKVAERIGKMYLLGFYVPKGACGWYDLSLEIGAWKNNKFDVNDAHTNRAGYRRRVYLKCD